MTKKRLLSSLMALVMVFTMFFTVSPMAVDSAPVSTKTLNGSPLLDNLMETATQFIVIRQYQMGGSHYAYTEALSDEMIGSDVWDGTETNFRPGSQMVLITLEKSGDKVNTTEEVLIDDPDGVVRDPDVSENGRTVVFSWKKERSDDYHLYEMNISTKAVRQLTFGSGISDMEPQYLANGDIVFSSSRTIQTVDCWKVPVSNLYICGPDGENIVRVGYDQVHTTFPTTTEDGRVIYTRWDYNDRNQMFVQGVFQMLQDGTNQTELFGNNSNFPTTLLHTREIPGTSNKYISIASGHHVKQAGKLVIVDVSKGRNNNDSVQFVFPDAHSRVEDSVDGYGQNGPIYKYPYAISESEFLVSYSAGGWTNGDNTPFSIYLMNTAGEKIELVSGSGKIPASQIVPIKTRTMTERPTSVDYGAETGVFYIGNIYEGDGLIGVEFGAAKSLRVVALDYRPYAVGATRAAGTGSADPYTPIATGNGSWDVKQVLGVVPIEEDGSALFRVPALIPVYFQVLDENGDLIQSMRSWSTLMPNETFSCVGCHEDKNTAPPAVSTNTIAMSKGVQDLVNDVWQTGEQYDDYDPYEDEPVGFSYLEEVQPILDESCIECHSNVGDAYDRINLGSMQNAPTSAESYIIEKRDQWRYTTTRPASSWTGMDFDDSNWKIDYAPFGKTTTAPKEPNTIWDESSIYMRKQVFITKSQLEDMVLYLDIAYTRNPIVYINGTRVWYASGSSSNYERIQFTETMKNALKVGHNMVTVQASKDTNGQFIDVSLKAEKIVKKDAFEQLIANKSDWKYLMSTSNNPPAGWNQINFDDGSWKTAKAPFGDREGWATSWTGSNNYIWIRKEFNIDDINDFKGSILTMNTWYDDTPEFYINGKQVFSDSGWIDALSVKRLPDSASDALVQGKNVMAIKCQNTTGGRQIETSLLAEKRDVQETVVLPVGQSGWKYVINNKPADGWYTEDFKDSSWQTGSALFGSDSKAKTKWSGENSDIWIRKTFNISDAKELLNKKLYLNIFYDEDPVVYLNGIQIFTASGYTTDYVSQAISFLHNGILKDGENVIAIKAHNGIGGAFIDAGITARDISTPVSFENINVIGNRTQREWPLSYLVLTGSQPDGGVNWVGNSQNAITNYISSMSQCEMLDPYQFGSTKSNIIELLRSGHGNLSDEEIRTFSAWIDLCVPAFGEYTENANWDNRSRKEAEEEQNKRDFYVMMDEYARNARANGGKYNGVGEINIKYSTSSGKVYETKDSGLAVLYTDVKYNTGDKVQINLPAGQKYLMVTLNSRMGESLVYVPDGVFNYSFPSLSNSYNHTVKTDTAYTHNTITARVATDKDLNTSHNLAKNPYDLKTVDKSYPHTTANAVYNNQSEFEVRNIIDGMTGNRGHGNYPSQSWGPNETGDFWVNIDMGREVIVDQLEIYIRADFPHDTYFTSGVLEFSDGTTQKISLRKTNEAQIVDVPSKITSSVKIKDLKTIANQWAGLSEVKVLGTELSGFKSQYKVDDKTKTVSDVSAGTDIDTFKQNISIGDVVVKKGTQVVSSGNIATDMTVEINGVTYDIAVTGDTNSDGTVTVTDVVTLRSYIMNDKTPTACQKIAANLDGSPSGDLTVTDIVSLRALIMGG